MCFWWRKPKVEIVEPEPEEGLREANIVQLIDRPYSLYSQKDPRWAKYKINGTKYTLASHGCLITCFAMLDGRPPYVMAEVLKPAYQGAELVVKSAAWILQAKSEYLTKDPKRLCIAETDHYKSKGVPQHFFIHVGDGTIIDPLDLHPEEKPCPYKIVSYRTVDFQKKVIA